MRGQACCFILGQGRPFPAGKGRLRVTQPRLPAKRRAFGPQRSRPEAVCRPGKAHSGQGNSVCRPQMAGLGRATALVGRKRRAAGRAATLVSRKWRAWDAQRRWSAAKGGLRAGLQRLSAAKGGLGARNSVGRPQKAGCGQGCNACRSQKAGLRRATALVGRKRRPPDGEKGSRTDKRYTSTATCRRDRTRPAGGAPGR
jgi:hypothetical protein